MSSPMFGKGGEQAAIISESQGGSKFARVNYFKLADKEQGVFRFITDSPDWIFVKQHPSVPTKNKPSDWPDKAKWPEGMPAVCRHDQAFVGMYSDCYVCDTPVMNPRDTTKPLKPALRVWALAVEREAVMGDGTDAMGGADKKGKLLGYRDATEEVEVKDGDSTKKVKQKKIVIVNMGMKNFFGALQGIFGIYGTVCDRDYAIKRSGEGLDTDYTIVPLDKTVGHEPGSESWDRLLKAVEEQSIDLEAIVAEKASDDYFARFFDPSKTSAPMKGKEEGGSAAAATTSTPPPSDNGGGVVDDDRLRAMRERVRGGASTEAPASEAAAPEAPAAPSAPSGPVNFD